MSEDLKAKKARLVKRIKSKENDISLKRDDGEDVEDDLEDLQELKNKLEGLDEDTKQEREKKDAAENDRAILNAIAVYGKGLCLHLGSQVRYFYKKTIVDTHRVTGAKLPETSLTFFSSNQLYPHFAEMQSKKSQIAFRQLVEGNTLKLSDGTDVTLDSRTYRKLGNTRHIPGPENYNLLDLVDILKPSGKEVKECPLILQALMLSLSGNVRNFEQDHFELSKPESYYWLEKWIYGVVCADIGNPMLGMPVIFGAGKVGKNALCDIIIPKILGTNLCFSATWDTIDGNFNAFKVGKVFTFIDEVPAREDWAKLKNYTGSPTSFVKEKYGPEFVIENTIAFMIGSNETVYPLPLEDGKQMTRVSPIEVTNKSLFATNLVELLGLTTVATKLYNAGVDINNLDEYELGDTYLKQFTEEWQGEAVLQEFVDYLHTTYGQVAYTLQPLRGEDWRKITSGKRSFVEQTAEYIMEQNPEFITLPELYEIYKIISGDRSNTTYQKQSSNLSIQIADYLKDKGYEKTSQVRVALSGGGGVNTQTTVFHKPEASLKNIKQNFDKYIAEEIVGTKTYRHLRYTEKPEIAEDFNSDGGFGVM